MLAPKEFIEMLRKHIFQYDVMKLSMESKMRKDLVKESFSILNDKLSDLVRIERYDHYLWLYTHENDDMIGIVHGGIGKPFEFKVINIGDTKQQDFQYDNWKEFKSFLQYELRRHILALAL